MKRRRLVEARRTLAEGVLLPNELWLYILSFIAKSDRASFMRVCKWWLQLGRLHFVFDAFDLHTRSFMLNYVFPSLTRTTLMNAIKEFSHLPLRDIAVCATESDDMEAIYQIYKRSPPLAAFLPADKAALLRGCLTNDSRAIFDFVLAQDPPQVLDPTLALEEAVKGYPTADPPSLAPFRAGVDDVPKLMTYFEEWIYPLLQLHALSTERAKPLWEMVLCLHHGVYGWLLSGGDLDGSIPFASGLQSFLTCQRGCAISTLTTYDSLRDAFLLTSIALHEEHNFSGALVPLVCRTPEEHQNFDYLKNRFGSLTERDDPPWRKRERLPALPVGWLPDISACRYFACRYMLAYAEDMHLIYLEVKLSLQFALLAAHPAYMEEIRSSTQDPHTLFHRLGARELTFFMSSVDPSCVQDPYHCDTEPPNFSSHSLTLLRELTLERMVDRRVGNSRSRPK